MFIQFWRQTRTSTGGGRVRGNFPAFAGSQAYWGARRQGKQRRLLRPENGSVGPKKGPILPLFLGGAVSFLWAPGKRLAPGAPRGKAKPGRQKQRGNFFRV